MPANSGVPIPCPKVTNNAFVAPLAVVPPPKAIPQRLLRTIFRPNSSLMVPTNLPVTGSNALMVPSTELFEVRRVLLKGPKLEHFRNYCRPLMQRLNHAFALSGVISRMALAIASSSASLVLALAERRICLSLDQAFSMGFKSGE